MKTEPIDNSADVLDSRDIIARIEELQSERDDFEPNEEEGITWADDNPDEAAELAALEALAEEASGSPDWLHGETLIRESYFTDYIEELIRDCYEMPKEITSGAWPWRHVTVDYEGAAEEAKADYIEVDFDGVTYLIRA